MVGQCKQQVSKWHNCKFNIFCMKEPKHTMKMMSTHSSLITDMNRKEERRQSDAGEIFKFRLTEPFANHFNCQHEVDDDNNLQHQMPQTESMQ